MTRRSFLKCLGFSAAILTLPISLQTKIICKKVNDYSFINVKRNGAKGDSVTDDTIVIRKTLDKHNAIYFPNGIYKYSTNIIIKGV